MKLTEDQMQECKVWIRDAVEYDVQHEQTLQDSDYADDVYDEVLCNGYMDNQLEAECDQWNTLKTYASEMLDYFND